jgi:hypothetical protein
MTLYEKQVSPKGKVSYVPYVGYTPRPEDEMTDKQLITLAVSIGVTCLMTLEQNLPQHSRIGRQIRDVEQSILRLAHNCGEHVDREMVDYWASAFNTVMETIARCEQVAPAGRN